MYTSKTFTSVSPISRVFIYFFIVFTGLLKTQEGKAQICLLKNIRTSEINIIQDSINPLKIHIELMVDAILHCPNMADEFTPFSWGDGNSEDIPCSDTIYYGDLYKCIKYYRATHIYNSLPSDSIVILSSESYPTLNFVNIFTPGNNVSLATNAVLDFKQLSIRHGVISPKITGKLNIQGKAGEVLNYNPLINCDTAYYFRVHSIVPFETGSFHFGDMYSLKEISDAPFDSILLDSTTGHFYWNRPPHSGFYLFTYEISMYQQNRFILSKTRNYMIEVQDTLNTGFKEPTSDNKLLIYPNPNNGTFSINISSIKESIQQLHIQNMLGELVYETKSIDSNQDYFNLALPNGVYLMTISTNKTKYINNLIINK
ncbi:MAG: T9SS type A sorting domain-containing protein [Chitinophagales bacterium]|nr:T9SS type A sorting domain-containing protein [Chitinophagales bacterium]